LTPLNGGVWSITSHKDYPADASDAENRIRDVAINMEGLTVLGIASDVAADHRKFGVVRPAEEDLKEGSEGVGLLVAVTGISASCASRDRIGSIPSSWSWKNCRPSLKNGSSRTS
jgi:hypothetical protein